MHKISSTTNGREKIIVANIDRRHSKCGGKRAFFSFPYFHRSIFLELGLNSRWNDCTMHALHRQCFLLCETGVAEGPGIALFSLDFVHYRLIIGNYWPWKGSVFLSLLSLASAAWLKGNPDLSFISWLWICEENTRIVHGLLNKACIRRGKEV